MALISEVKPVSPDKYTFKPLVKVTTNPLARPTYPANPFEDSSVFSGSAMNVVDKSLGCCAVTAVICTPRIADMFRMVRLAPSPRPAVQAVARGTIVSLVNPEDGHPPTGEPETAAVKRPATPARDPPATMTEFL